MKRLVLNLRNIHRSLTIPMVILMILKRSVSNSNYNLLITKVVTVVMLFMVISGLVMYLYTLKMKHDQKKMKQAIH